MGNAKARVQDEQKYRLPRLFYAQPNLRVLRQRKQLKIMRKLFTILIILLLTTQADLYAKKVKQLTPDITWELRKDGTLVISGKGEMPLYERDKYPWVKKANKITSVVIGEGITKINRYSFSNYSYKKNYSPKYYSNKKRYQISSVTLPSTLITIAGYAFTSTYIETLKIPSRVEHIGFCAFKWCRITTLDLPLSVKSIDDEAFYHNNITNIINFPYGIQHIGASAFARNNITNLKLPSSLTEISREAFCDNNIFNVTIPSSVTKIGARAFKSNKIVALTIPEKVTEIGAEAFYENNISTLTIPKNVTRIGNNAFEGNKIKTLSVSSKEIGERAFESNPINDLHLGKEVRKIGEGAFVYNSIYNLNIPNSVTSIGEDAFAIDYHETYTSRYYSNWKPVYYKNSISSLPSFINENNCEKIGISKTAYREYDPTAEDCYDKGYKYYDKKDYATALKYFLKGTTVRDPSSYGYKGTCYLYAGWCYSHLDDPYKELEMMTAAQKLGEEYADPSSAKRKIAAIESKGKRKNAEEQLAKGNYDIAFNYCVEIYNSSKLSSDLNMVPNHFENKKDYINAIKYYKKIHNITQSSSYADKIAQLYFKRGNYTNAIEWYSILAQNGNKEAQYKLAQSYEKVKNKNLAIFWYRKAAEQKHLKAEEALAHYGIYLTSHKNTSKTQSSNSSSSTTTKNQSVPQQNTYTPEYGFRDVWVQCTQCHGSGKCWSCHGNGWCVSTRYDGSYNSTYQCPICNGTGNCTTCFGTGGHYEKQQYQIR